MLPKVKAIYLSTGKEVMIDPCVCTPAIYRLVDTSVTTPAVDMTSDVQTIGLLVSKDALEKLPVTTVTTASTTDLPEPKRGGFAFKQDPLVIEIKQKLDEAGAKYDKRWGYDKLKKCYDDFLSLK